MNIGRKVLYGCLSLVLSTVIMLALGNSITFNNWLAGLWIPTEVVKTAMFLLLCGFNFCWLDYAFTITRDWRTKID